jgi:hypothetical protein
MTTEPPSRAPSTSKTPRGGSMVSVTAHSREGGRVEVDAHTRSAPQRARTAAAEDRAASNESRSNLDLALDEIERQYRRTVEEWRAQGLTMAARHLEHFLDGGGKSIFYGADEARRFGPVQKAEADAQEQLEHAVRYHLENTLKPGSRARRNGRLNIELIARESYRPGEFPPGRYGYIAHGTSLARGFVTGDLDQDLAIGKTAVEVRFLGSWRRQGSRFLIDGEAVLGWKDRYDFDDRAPGGAGANSLKDYRGAKVFEFGGATWRQRVRGEAAIAGPGVGRPELTFTDE